MLAATFTTKQSKLHDVLHGALFARCRRPTAGDLWRPLSCSPPAAPAPQASCCARPPTPAGAHSRGPVQKQSGVSPSSTQPCGTLQPPCRRQAPCLGQIPKEQHQAQCLKCLTPVVTRATPYLLQQSMASCRQTSHETMWAMCLAGAIPQQAATSPLQDILA